MQNQVNNNINVMDSSLSQAMSASSAMIVTGLEKELKSNQSNIVINDPKINLKELEEYLQKLTNTTSVEKIKKREEEKRRNEEENGKKPKSFRVSSSIRKPAEPFEWKTKDRITGNIIIDFFASFQKSVLQNLLNFALLPGVEELLRGAREIVANLDGFRLEKIDVKRDGKIIFFSELTPEERRFLALTDELKILYIGELLEDDWLKLTVVRLRKNFVISSLNDMRTEKDVLDKVKMQAKQIAYLKIIHELKAAHLKRVFCGSRKDFEYYSRVIGYYTQKIRRIDLTRPEAEIEMIKTQLEKVAFETAHYKLELLYSMQKLTFDKTRQKDIHWLETTLSQIRHV